MKFNQAFGTGILLVVSLAVGTLLCEAGARLILSPADYLSPTMMRDEILGISIEPNSSGYDEWGFRNHKVPPTADVVAVGDSHTYGNTAAMSDSWPSVTAQRTGLQVYNLGMGGYGPNQYFHLLTTKGLKLHPKWVLCGLYMGDDFENAFSVTYGLDHWSSLRNGERDNVNVDIWGTSEPPVWGAGVRNWLSEHSIVYRLVLHGPLIAIAKEAIRFRETSAGRDPYTTALIVEDQNIREAFRPLGMAERQDLASGPVREGMRITLHLLTEMDKACREAGCRFLVVIIPTKETVFSEYIEKMPELHLHAELNRVITNERAAKRTLVDFLADEHIAYLDTLPALQNAVKNQLYAQTTRDMHPGKNGYRVIGEAVAQYLNR